MEPVSTSGEDDRLHRALLADVRQELEAPASALLGYAERLLDDVERQGLDGFAGDLGRLRHAALKLAGTAAGLLAPQGTRQDFAAFRRRLRHDLRTPINAIKGYGEMLLEDAEAEGRDALCGDFRTLLEAAAGLLAKIDALVASAPEGVQQEAAASAVMAAIQPPAQPRAAAAARILVVDDTEANRDLLSRRLEREGHVVTAAGGGQEALALVAAEPFDLMLLDLMMPDINGYEVLTRLKGDARTRDIPVIVISALDELDSIVRCIEAGAEDYLPKPFEPVLLRARIGASLDKKRLRDREQAAMAELRAEKERSETLLLNILPQPIVARMQRGETNIADRFQDVTILFSDIVGFTRMSARRSAAEVVELLNAIFSAVDRLAIAHGIEKIKTIGDAYMAVAGLPEPRPDHAQAIARLALAMRDGIGEIARRHGEELQLRIGIHTGDLVAGIIGTHKFAYDVWGDTVNTASAMESHGIPGEIQVSDETRIRLAAEFVLEPRGPTAIKGKGEMTTWLLRGKRKP